MAVKVWAISVGEEEGAWRDEEEHGDRVVRSHSARRVVT